MPLYEYRCRRCSRLTSVIERIDDWRFWRRRCEHCGSFRIKKTFSLFFTSYKRTRADMMNELRGMGNVQFVPQSPRPEGPPPGGCPYADSSGETETSG